MAYVELPAYLRDLPYAEQCRIRREEADRRAVERRWALHSSGVHVECRTSGSKFASEIDSCQHAEGVEWFHVHDFEGPLVCGCDDFSTVEGI